jgi:hypothetical protein
LLRKLKQVSRLYCMRQSQPSTDWLRPTLLNRSDIKEILYGRRVMPCHIPGLQYIGHVVSGDL